MSGSNLSDVGPVRVGIVGCGRIFPAYARTLKLHFSHLVQIVACADISAEASRSRAEEFAIPRSTTVADVIADSSIELVVDLTNPVAHFDVSHSALTAGKHVFVEKPLSVTRELGRRLVDSAASAGVLLAGAADTFLGPGLQAVRQLIADNRVGRVAVANAMFGTGEMVRRYLSLYGGPLFDMGSYYVTALVALFGPVQRVSATIADANLADGGNAAVDSPLAFPFETPVLACAVLSFASGPIASLTLAGDTARYFPRLEIYGSKGTIVANDPNGYCGTVTIRGSDSAVADVPVPALFDFGQRGLGVAELAHAIRSGRRPSADGELMYHVLDVLHSIREAGLAGRSVDVASTVSLPEAFDVQVLLGSEEVA